MAEKLQAFLKEHDRKKQGKGSLLASGTSSGASSAGEGDSDTSKLLSWVPSVSISMPKVFPGSEKNETSGSSWFKEANNDPICPALIRDETEVTDTHTDDKAQPVASRPPLNNSEIPPVNKTIPENTQQSESSRPTQPAKKQAVSFTGSPKSRKQRMIGFAVCVFTGILCFSLAAMYAPLLVLKARKFSLLYSLGSLFMINSFSFLWGPWNHMKHLFTKERIPFTIAYFGSLFATLYFAMWLRSTVLTIIAAVVQIIALTWYIISYIPGGQTGLRFITKMFTSLVSRTCRKGVTV